MKVGITGGNGFIGYHTYHVLKHTTDWDIIKLDRNFYDDDRIKECDWVIHLAGMNRGDEEEIYNINIDLTQKLLDSVSDNCNIIFSSSTQVEQNTVYGKSKLRCEMMLDGHINLRIPNVFGPFCKPNYNSFVATFCHKLCNDEIPKIINDNEVNLVYVNDVVDIFRNCILNNGEYNYTFKIVNIKVSEVLDKLKYYKKHYLEEGRIPLLDGNFNTHLFNTFISYLPTDKRLLDTSLNSDDRGSLTEVVKVDKSEGQVFFSTTNSGYIRGEHFHTRKFERFCVIEGEAVIRIRKLGTDEIYAYFVSGERIQFIDMPVLHTHNIENIGKNKMTAVFWISELYNENNPDTFFEKV